jgi:phosphate transport system substrate-binding protein
MRKDVWVMLVVCSLMLILAALGCGSPRGTEKPAQGEDRTSQKVNESIQVKGSDTMVNLGKSWAQAFTMKYPDMQVAVTGGGSGTGIAALVQGATDIAQASRSIKPEEIEEAQKNGITPKEFIVGYDGISVIMNPANPVQKLTIEQLGDIFKGKITNWNMVGGNDATIVILSREINSGTHVYFKEHVLNKGDSKGTVEFAASALMMQSSQAIADEVASNPNAIGYVGMGYVTEKQKALPIAKDNGSEAIAPTVENVLSTSYPISRPLFMYTKGEPEGTVKNFMDFVFSPEGQKILTDEGFVPLK